jgi:hypothetical protein
MKHVLTENINCYKFIIITIILLPPHASARRCGPPIVELGVAPHDGSLHPIFLCNASLRAMMRE